MLKSLKKDVDAGLRSFLEKNSKHSNLKTISPLLYSGLRDFLSREGKRIRPLLFLIAYRGYTRKKRIANKKLIHASLSMELLHDFLLIHDDVIDNSDLRRGKPTLHKLFNSTLKLPADSELGSGLSIAAGDILFAFAIETLLNFDENLIHKERALKIFTETAAATGLGEFIDVINNTRKIEAITEKDVFRTYTLKTAKYTFEGPLVIGATLAGAKKKETHKLSELGILLGQAFQIQDDLLDVFSSSKKIGKPILSDLAESKKTLIVWKTYKELPAKKKKVLKHLLEKNKKTRKDLLEFRSLINKTGSGKYCRDRALSLLKKADVICSSIKMKSVCKAAVNQLIDELAVKTNLLTNIK